MADVKDTTGASLADRLTKPDGSKFESPKVDVASSAADVASLKIEDVPAKPAGDSSSSWADEVETPVQANPEPSTETTTPPKESNDDETTLDGATEPQNGTPMLAEPDYEVNVKLSDVQADPNNPLYSVKNFNDLGL